MFRLFQRFASRLGARSAPPTPLGSALSALDRRRFDEAEALLTALIDRSGGAAARERAFLLNKRGVARIGLAQTEAARADFAAALQAAPGYAPALANLGNLELEAGRPGDAIERYEAAIRADGEYAIAYLNASVAYKRVGRIDDAVRALRTAKRLEGRRRPAPTPRT